MISWPVVLSLLSQCTEYSSMQLGNTMCRDVCMWVWVSLLYMLLTNFQPLAQFKAVRPVSKLSQSTYVRTCMHIYCSARRA